MGFWEAIVGMVQIISLRIHKIKIHERMPLKISQLLLPFCPLWWNFFLSQEFYSCDRKCLSVTGNFVLWQEISSCSRKYHHAAGNLLLWQKISFFFVLSEEISSCDGKFLPVLGNFSLWQEIFFCPRRENIRPIQAI